MFGISRTLDRTISNTRRSEQNRASSVVFAIGVTDDPVPDPEGQFNRDRACGTQDTWPQKLSIPEALVFGGA
jgi:hypothetical protein